ncbi:hypothetical protein, partial [Buttiauxella brennerae]|uniref:hypothetical protein n=1 Tax=Buttiauxella brennerae TaxID=82988 RepID=UPI00286EBCA8
SSKNSGDVPTRGNASREGKELPLSNRDNPHAVSQKSIPEKKGTVFYLNYCFIWFYAGFNQRSSDYENR